jgi:hypothetical protein
MAVLCVAEIYGGKPRHESCVIGRPRWNREISAGDPDVAVRVILPGVRFGGEILTPGQVQFGTGTLVPLLAVQLPQRAADDIACALVLAAVGLNDTKIFLSGTKADAHEPTVRQLLSQAS